MEALRALERAERRKAKPEPTPAPKKTAKSPRATGGKTKKANRT